MYMRAWLGSLLGLALGTGASSVARADVAVSPEIHLGARPLGYPRPVVASDGTNYMVAWAGLEDGPDAGAGVVTLRRSVVRRDGAVLVPNGRPMAGPFDLDEAEWTPPSLGSIDIASSGVDYLVVWGTYTRSL